MCIKRHITRDTITAKIPLISTSCCRIPAFKCIIFFGWCRWLCYLSTIRNHLCGWWCSMTIGIKRYTVIIQTYRLGVRCCIIVIGIPNKFRFEYKAALLTVWNLITIRIFSWLVGSGCNISQLLVVAIHFYLIFRWNS